MNGGSGGKLYEFVLRGLLAEEALDRAGRTKPELLGMEESELSRMLSWDVLDPEFVAQAREMGAVYVAVAAFENSARKLIKTVLLDQLGEDWWEKSVSERIRKRAETRREDEQLTKWHGQRGEDLISYTELGDLASIIQNNWEHFEPYVRSVDWVKAILQVIERSRNVIMHSGLLEKEDVERVGINIRDWVKQVGA